MHSTSTPRRGFIASLLSLLPVGLLRSEPARQATGIFDMHGREIREGDRVAVWEKYWPLHSGGYGPAELVEGEIREDGITSLAWDPNADFSGLPIKGQLVLSGPIIRCPVVKTELVVDGYYNKSVIPLPWKSRFPIHNWAKPDSSMLVEITSTFT